MKKLTKSEDRMIWREERKLDCARYYVENKSTIRDTATALGISKTTVHTYLLEVAGGKIPFSEGFYLANKVKEQLEKNKEERAFRGGYASKHKCTK